MDREKREVGTEQDNNQQKSINRRTVLQGIGTIAGSSTLPVVVSGRERYPTVDHEYAQYPVSEIAVEHDGNFRYTKQQHHDRIAFSTTVFNHGYELYLADGVSSADDTPKNIYQITSDTKIGVADLTWIKGNRLEFWRDGTVYQLKIPQSNKIFEAEEISTGAIPATVDTEGGEK